MKKLRTDIRELRVAREIWGRLSSTLEQSLLQILASYRLSLSRGDLVLLNGNGYITNAGLLRIAARKHCLGMRVTPVMQLCDARSSQYAFRATVYKSATCKGFTGYGDANPSNVSSVVRGAELRVAETRAVNRALRKAYAIAVCSVEELGSPASAINTAQRKSPTGDIARDPEKKEGCNGHGTNGNGSLLRDRLRQLIRQHGLDAELVKAYAIDFCATNTLWEASREQSDAFVAHVASCAEKDRNALLCQLNRYPVAKEGAA